LAAKAQFDELAQTIGVQVESPETKKPIRTLDDLLDLMES